MRNPQCSGKKALCSPRSLGCLINITALNRMFGGHWMEWTPFGVGCREFWNLCWEWLEIPGLFPSWINSVSLSFSLPYYEGGTDFQDLAKLKKKKKTHTARAGLYFLFVSESLELGLRRWDCGGAQTNLCISGLSLVVKSHVLLTFPSIVKLWCLDFLISFLSAVPLLGFISYFLSISHPSRRD